LFAAWISVFAALRLYDRALSRRNPGALVGAALSWAGLVALGAAIYPESGLGLGEIVPASLLALLCAGAFRLLYEQGIERIYRRGLGQTPVVVVGRGEDRKGVRQTMESAPGAYSIAGEVDLGGGDLAALRDTLDRTGGATSSWSEQNVFRTINSSNFCAPCGCVGCPCGSCRGL
jgi:hypothetical protein